MCDCKVIVIECVAKQHRMVVCKMVPMVKKKSKESKSKNTMVESEEDKLLRSV